MILMFCRKYDCKATVLPCVGRMLHAREYVELCICRALKAGWAFHRICWPQYCALQIFPWTQLLQRGQELLVASLLEYPTENFLQNLKKNTASENHISLRFVKK